MPTNRTSEDFVLNVTGQGQGHFEKRAYLLKSVFMNRFEKNQRHNVFRRADNSAPPMILVSRSQVKVKVTLKNGVPSLIRIYESIREEQAPYRFSPCRQTANPRNLIQDHRKVKGHGRGHFEKRVTLSNPYLLIDPGKTNIIAFLSVQTNCGSKEFDLKVKVTLKNGILSQIRIYESIREKQTK